MDGAHNAMPKYTDSYKSVKNLAPVADCLKGQGGRSEQSTLHWQFGLRDYDSVEHQDRER